jgi:hypothetical protein
VPEGTEVVIQELPLAPLYVGIFRGERLVSIDRVADERAALCSCYNVMNEEMGTGLTARPIAVLADGGAE